MEPNYLKIKEITFEIACRGMKPLSTNQDARRMQLRALLKREKLSKLIALIQPFDLDKNISEIAESIKDLEFSLTETSLKEDLYGQFLVLEGMLDETMELRELSSAPLSVLLKITSTFSDLPSHINIVTTQAPIMEPYFLFLQLNHTFLYTLTVMNLKCLICSDLFSPYAEIYATACGHLFHYHCLIQWIDRSKTCPQCRARATEKSIIRVYLSVEEHEEEVDLAALHNKLDNLQFQIKLKDKDVKIAEDKRRVAATQNLGLREEIKELENKSRVLESAMHALKEQVTYFKSKSKVAAAVEAELTMLKTKVNNFTKIQSILDMSRLEVDTILRDNHNAEVLTLMVVTLKKELINSRKHNMKLGSTTRQLSTETQSYKRKLRSLHEEKVKLLKELECHKNCKKEREFLKKAINDLQNGSGSNDMQQSDVNRVILESPIPNSKLDLISKKSPSVPDIVHLIKDSDSPYLRVQSSSVGLSEVGNYNQLSKSLNTDKILEELKAQDH
ncbi:hypothetical protein FQA39_LY04699 [Lamprigera yunnana]|nr:hypothetical protein FQA39_LY04699 [Lamprigera yunnana]